MMRSLNLFSLCALAPLLAVSTAQTQNEANCTVFTWNQQPGYLINDTAVRVSAASTCSLPLSQTGDCPITATGDQQGTFSYNISALLPNAYWNSPSDSFIHKIILDAVNASLDGAMWGDSAIGMIDTTQALAPGASGYINFTAIRRCFEGTMSNCTGGLEDGLGIQACAPVTTPIRGANAVPILDGYYAVVEIPEDDVDRYSDPFAGQAHSTGTRFSAQTPIIVMASALLFAAAMT